MPPDLPLPPNPGPVVREHTVTFRLDDPDHALGAVRLYQEVRIPGDRLDFRHDGDSWLLEIERPDVDRMEYLFELTHADGATVTLTDPANPRRVAGAFGTSRSWSCPATTGRAGCPGPGLPAGAAT